MFVKEEIVQLGLRVDEEETEVLIMLEIPRNLDHS